MMIKSRQDILDRTMANLRHIESVVKERPLFPRELQVFEVTQLVNSFLMTVIQNWDDLKRDWPYLSQKGIEWPQIKTSEPNQFARQCVGKIRDALAHGLFAFEEGQFGEIAALHLWTCPDRAKVDWHATITIDQMRGMLECFVEHAKRKERKPRVPKKKGDSCNPAIASDHE